jgi:hypothetical protein
MFLGVCEVADECAGEPPRFGQYAFDSRSVPKARLKTWSRDNCEVRDSNRAGWVLLATLANLPKGGVAEILFTAATDYLYMNASHTFDFVNKAFETLEHVGWEEHADTVLASVVPQITGASRAEETSSWRTPVDLAALCFNATELLPDLVAAGEGKRWERPDDLRETLLSDGPEATIDALTDAIREGATQRELVDVVARAATHQVTHFATSNEFPDWDTVHHTLTYANTVHRATAKTDATEPFGSPVGSPWTVSTIVPPASTPPRSRPHAPP